MESTISGLQFAPTCRVFDLTNVWVKKTTSFHKIINPPNLRLFFFLMAEVRRSIKELILACSTKGNSSHLGDFKSIWTVCIWMLLFPATAVPRRQGGECCSFERGV